MTALEQQLQREAGTGPNAARREELRKRLHWKVESVKQAQFKRLFDGGFITEWFFQKFGGKLITRCPQNPGADAGKTLHVGIPVRGNHDWPKNQ